MVWAHEGAVISLTTSTATWTRAAGLGGGGLESAAVCWIEGISGPTGAVPRLTGAALGSSSGVFESAATVPGLGSTVAALEPSAEIPVPTAGALESDPTSSGGAGTKMESDSGEGLIDGLRRR